MEPVSLQDTPAFKRLHLSFETRFNERLRKDYDALIAQLLRKQVPQSVINELPALQHVNIRVLDRVVSDRATKAVSTRARTLTKTCIALKENGMRCTLRAVAVSSSTTDGQFCRHHAKDAQYGRLDDLNTCMRTYDFGAPANYDDDTYIMHLGHQKGRKYYSLPTTQEQFDQSYVRVSHVVIDGDPYLMDDGGVIYGFTPSLVAIGQRVNDVVKWY